MSSVYRRIKITIAPFQGICLPFRFGSFWPFIQSIQSFTHSLLESSRLFIFFFTGVRLDSIRFDCVLVEFLVLGYLFIYFIEMLKCHVYVYYLNIIIRHLLFQYLPTTVRERTWNHDDTYVFKKQKEQLDSHSWNNNWLSFRQNKKQITYIHK